MNSSVYHLFETAVSKNAFCTKTFSRLMSKIVYSDLETVQTLFFVEMCLGFKVSKLSIFLLLDFN